jgi:ABC-type transporter Mla subunit MlaD
MNKDRNAFLAGMFILISVALIVSVVVAITGTSQFLEPAQTLSVSFTLKSNIGGLSTGDDVRLGGAKVGQIKRIDFVPATNEGDPTILITFSMPKRFVVHENAVLAVEGTLTGGSWLNFKTLGTGTVLVEGKSLPGTEASLQSAMGEAGEVMSEVHTVTLPNINKVVAQVQDSAAVLAELLHKNKDKISDTFSNIHKITSDTRERWPVLLDHAKEVIDKVSSELDTVKQSLADVKATAEHTRAITANVRSILTDNRSRIDHIIVTLAATSDNLKHAIDEVRRSPWRLFYHPSANELGNLNLFDVAREFSDGAAAMNDAAKALRDASKDPSTDPQRLKLLIQNLQESFDNFSKVQDKLWKEVKE